MALSLTSELILALQISVKLTPEHDEQSGKHQAFLESSPESQIQQASESLQGLYPGSWPVNDNLLLSISPHFTIQTLPVQICLDSSLCHEHNSQSSWQRPPNTKYRNHRMDSWKLVATARKLPNVNPPLAHEHRVR